MTDLNGGTLFHSMLNILLAVIEFTLSLVFLGLLAVIVAYLFTFKDRTHFFERRIPRKDIVIGFSAGFAIAYAFILLFLFLIWGPKGTSALTLITYSVCTIWTVTVGVCLGGLILGMLWNLVGKKFIETSSSGSVEDGSGNYEAVATAEGRDIELGEGDSENARGATKES